MGESLTDFGISLWPLRPAILTFTVDEEGLEFVRCMIEVMQKRYGMSYERAVEELNTRLGARDGHEAASITFHGAGLWWFHDGVEESVRSRFEGNYWVRDERAKKKVEEWKAGAADGKAVHECLGWTEAQYAKWMEDGTLPMRGEAGEEAV